VSGIPSDVSYKELRWACQQYGALSALQYPPKDGRLGVAFVHFRRPRAGVGKLLFARRNVWPHG